MTSMVLKTATRSRKVTNALAHHAAMWRMGYAEAKPPMRLVCKVFGVSQPTVLKAIREIKNGNGNGNGHAWAPLSIDDVTRWWAAATDADRATFVRSVGVGSAWRAIEANLG
jgi:hypothetical protein